MDESTHINESEQTLLAWLAWSPLLLGFVFPLHPSDIWAFILLAVFVIGCAAWFKLARARCGHIHVGCLAVMYVPVGTLLFVNASVQTLKLLLNLIAIEPA